MPGDRSDRTCDLLLSGGALVAPGDARRVIEPGSIAIAGERIVAAGDAAELAGWVPTRRVDCAGKAIMSGFVDCHTHLFQTLARGLGDGFGLRDWLNRFMWPYALTINAAEARTAAMLGAAQAARSGTTCVIDNHYAPSDLDATLAVVDAIDAVGLRGVVARGIVGSSTEVARRMGLVPAFFSRSTEEELDITRGCLEAVRDHGRIAVWPAPLNVAYVDQELLRASVQLGREFGVRWHTHCCEGRLDAEIYADVHGIRPVRWLAREGLLGHDATLAHGIWLDEREVEQVGSAGAAVAYNPVSNGYIGSGFIPLRQLRTAGAVVGLGTDGAAVTGQDMFETMKHAVLAQRNHEGDTTALSAAEAIELATRGGARLAAVDAGELAPGKLADVIVVGLSGIHASPAHRLAGTVVYASRAADVEMTIVGGRIVYEDGKVLGVDEAGLLSEAAARSKELLERGGLTRLGSPEPASTVPTAGQDARVDAAEASPS